MLWHSDCIRMEGHWPAKRERVVTCLVIILVYGGPSSCLADGPKITHERKHSQGGGVRTAPGLMHSWINLNEIMHISQRI